MRAQVMAGLLCCLAASAHAAVVHTTIHGATAAALDSAIRADDLIAGLIAVELPGDQGWHLANPASMNSLHPDGLPAFTDGAGALSGLTGLLRDFPGAGTPTKIIRYDLPAPRDLHEINILTGNGGLDGRVFSTTVVRYSTTGANGRFTTLGYFQSDPSGTTNSGQWGSTLVHIFDDLAGPLASHVTNLRFDFYAVDNTSGQMRDPYDGPNAYTGADDGLTAAFVAPLVWEIDVISLSCPCERTGDSPASVDVFDLLAYLSLWFAADPAAELTGDAPANIDVFDLLTFLECWFPASAGGPCP